MRSARCGYVVGRLRCDVRGPTSRWQGWEPVRQPTAVPHAMHRGSRYATRLRNMATATAHLRVGATDYSPSHEILDDTRCNTLPFRVRRGIELDEFDSLVRVKLYREYSCRVPIQLYASKCTLQQQHGSRAASTSRSSHRHHTLGPIHDT